MSSDGVRPARRKAPDRKTPLDWPTIAVAVGVYGGWVLVTALHGAIPKALLPFVGGWLIAWHGSLQHETIHGRPTPWPKVNAMIGYAPLSLWLPYGRYRQTHLAHHATPELTDPAHDPESRYVAAPSDLGAWVRFVSARAQATLPGRLVLGPWLTVIGFLGGEAARLLRGDTESWRIWIRHAFGAILVLTWLHACRIGFTEYVLAFVYPGAALTLLRSFAEHRADPVHERRVAIVENAPVLGLLYLNNNLHVVHHARPDLAWWRLPRVYARQRATILEANGGLVYAGYAGVVRRFLWRPHDLPIHPARAASQGSERGT
jgi:fatty acid desaturase